MGDTTFIPSKMWESKVSSTTYNTAARAGEADTVTTLEVDVTQWKLGQWLLTGDYWMYQLALEFDLSDIIGYQIETVEFRLHVEDDFTATQTWTGRARQGNWPTDDGFREVDHLGSGGMSSAKQLANFTMTTADDIPTVSDPWTDVSGVTMVQAAVGSTATPGDGVMKLLLHSARQQSELAPVDREQWGGAGGAYLIVTHHAPVEAVFTIGVPAFSVVDETQQSASFSVSPPSLAVTDNGGPVPAVAFTLPEPTMTATTTRRWQHDELYGRVNNDARRYGRVT